MCVSVCGWLCVVFICLCVVCVGGGGGSACPVYSIFKMSFKNHQPSVCVCVCLCCVCLRAWQKHYMILLSHFKLEELFPVPCGGMIITVDLTIV